jgi:hypothetical protein
MDYVRTMQFEEYAEMVCSSKNKKDASITYIHGAEKIGEVQKIHKEDLIVILESYFGDETHYFGAQGRPK